METRCRQWHMVSGGNGLDMLAALDGDDDYMMSDAAKDDGSSTASLYDVDCEEDVLEDDDHGGASEPIGGASGPSGGASGPVGGASGHSCHRGHRGHSRHRRRRVHGGRHARQSSINTHWRASPFGLVSGVVVADLNTGQKAGK